MPIFGGAARGALLKLVCPHCKTVQARARGAVDAVYRCTACRRTFSREQGLKAQR